MSKFYSIISISINNHTNDKISIGLLCVYENKLYFNYSIDLLKKVRDLIGKDAYNLALLFFKNIDNEIKTINFKINDSLLSEIEISGIRGSESYNEKYINYLNRYSNNLIRFTKPTSIDIDNFNFNKLYSSLFLKQIKEEPNIKNDFKSKVKSKYLNHYSDSIDIDFKISNSKLKSYLDKPIPLFPKTLSMFGKNGAFVTGNIIDFTTSEDTIASNINRFSEFRIALNNFSDNDNKFYIIGNKPNKLSYKEQFEIWNYFKNVKTEFVLLETNQLKEKLESFKVDSVKPVSMLEDSLFN